MPEAADPLLVERRDGVAWLTLNRPGKLNALDRAILDRLRHELEHLSTDPAIRVVVLTGAGRAFCAGADLTEVAGPGRDAFLDDLLRTFLALRACPKPVVAALNGLTVAGGLELALGCDLLLAAESARIGDAHVRHGLVPGGGAASLLPRLIGLPRARQMLLTGALFPAAELASWGLVSRVVPDDELLAEASGLATQLAALPPAALAATKRSLDQGADAAIRRDAATMREHLATEEASDGVARFLGERPIGSA